MTRRMSATTDKTGASINIIFDLDGTLIDSAPDIQSVANGILRDHRKSDLSLQETRSFVGEGAAVFVKRMMAARSIEETPQSFAQIHEAFIAQYEYAVDKATFYPGALDTLKALRAEGYKLGLCTNKPEAAARAVIRHMQIEEFFDSVIAGGMLSSRKPEPDMLLATMAQLGEAHTLYVGDSEIDAETAERAGVPFALFTLGYRKTPVKNLSHDWHFDHFAALLEIARQADPTNSSDAL